MDESLDLGLAGTLAPPALYSKRTITESLGRLTSGLFGSRPSTPGSRQFGAAFTLMEVMIAGGILFMCLFAILGLIVNSLRYARSLQRMPVDAGILAAEASLNQKLAEGSDSGDFGDLYPDYRWTSATNEVGTNGLFQVDYIVYRHSGDQAVESRMSLLLYRPDSPRRLGP